MVIFVLYKAVSEMHSKPVTPASLKKKGFNIILFILLYIVILQGFYFYVGLISPGGRLFSPFLSRHANFPGWLAVFIAKTSGFLLQFAGYSVYQRKPFSLAIAGSSGVTIGWACIGVGAISLWIAFIASHRAPVRYKLKWILPGIILLCILNIARVIIIALSLYYRWHYPMHFDVHTGFNVLTYSVIAIFMYLFAGNYKRLNQSKKNNSAGIDVSMH
ncbi:hypothetical protein [Parafilimonas sp.]|uniref:hypothetical protein n=1 Tax=Parafilimonas sp. TaxID=1969739 RepID=UPI0039E2F41E